MTTLSTDSIFTKAYHHYRKGQMEKALDSFMHLVDQNIQTAECLTYIGNIHFNQGAFDEAISYWEKSLQDDHTFVDAWINMGMVYSHRKEWDKAFEYLQKAEQIAPDRQDIPLSMGQILLQKGKPDEAKALIAPLCKKADPEPNILLFLAQIQVASQRLDLAEQTLNDLLKYKPNLPEAKINLGQVLMNQGKLEEARMILNEVLGEHPNHFHALAAYGKLLADIGEHRSALGYLQKAKQMQPTDWSLDLYIGNAFQNIGQIDQAITAFRQAAMLNPHDLMIKQSLSRALSRFVPPWHFSMLADEERNNAYETAILEKVDSSSTVLEIGTGSGLLSLMAAKYNAKYVYTCEESTYTYDAAQQIIQKNDHKSVIRLWNKRSTALTPSDFNATPNVLIAEIFDAGLFGEGAIKTFRHALTHLCGPNCQIIPAKATIYGQLINLPQLSKVHPVNAISGFDLSPFDQFRMPKEYISKNIVEHRHHLLSQPQKVLDVDFKNLFPETPVYQYIEETIYLTATDNNTAHAFIFWFDLFLTEKITLSNRPGRLDNHWGQAIYFFDQPIKVSAGRSYKLTMCYNDHTIWFKNLTPTKTN